MATPLSKAPYGLVALLGLAVAALAPACMPSSESREPEPDATPYATPYQPALYSTPSFLQITPTVAPPCDATLYECNPDAKVVDLCKQQQQDQTRCDPYIEKTLYEQLKAKVADAASAAECKSTKYVKTQEGGTVRVRSSMDTSHTGNILGQVGHGSSLCVLGTEGTWYKIKFASKTGYIYRTYVSETHPGPALKPPTSVAGKACARGTTLCKVIKNEQNCWRDRGDKWQGLIVTDDDLTMVNSGNSYCFGPIVGIRVAWGLKHRTSAMRKSNDLGGCYVEISNLQCP